MRETIQHQINGNLSAKEEENKRLTDTLISAGIDPTGKHVASATSGPSKVRVPRFNSVGPRGPLADQN
jgi:hypothetical protein